MKLWNRAWILDSNCGRGSKLTLSVEIVERHAVVHDAPASGRRSDSRLAQCAPQRAAGLELTSTVGGKQTEILRRESEPQIEGLADAAIEGEIGATQR